MSISEKLQKISDAAATLLVTQDEISEALKKVAPHLPILQVSPTDFLSEACLKAGWGDALVDDQLPMFKAQVSVTAPVTGTVDSAPDNQEQESEVQASNPTGKFLEEYQNYEEESAAEFISGDEPYCFLLVGKNTCMYVYLNEVTAPGNTAGTWDKFVAYLQGDYLVLTNNPEKLVHSRYKPMKMQIQSNACYANIDSYTRKEVRRRLGIPSGEHKYRGYLTVTPDAIYVDMKRLIKQPYAARTVTKKRGTKVSV